jgi:hypothetical protein
MAGRNTGSAVSDTGKKIFMMEQSGKADGKIRSLISASSSKVDVTRIKWVAAGCRLPPAAGFVFQVPSTFVSLS